MRGLGNCKFEPANAAWGFDGGNAWSAAFAATWEKGQSWPTLAVGNYIDVTQDMFPWGSCTDNWLHRPDGAKFAAPTPLKPSFCALSMLFSDWNRSGTPSLRVANDREYYKGGQEQLWHVEPGQDPRLYTEAEGWKRLRIWGMGLASYDLNFDGYPEYFVTSMADNKLQTMANPETKSATFKDEAFAKGAIAQRPYTGTDLNPSTGWHAQFEDVNNDGLADLFIAKGNVDAMPDFALKDPNNLLLQRPDGTFQEAGDRAGVAATGLSRGAALADLNADGLMDLVVVNRREPVQIWRNTTQSANHWLTLTLTQPAPNTDAIGAWVEVKMQGHTQRREITIGGGQAGGNLGAVHFGLGDQPQAEVRVIWPDGSEGAWQMLTADAAYRSAKTLIGHEKRKIHHVPILRPGADHSRGVIGMVRAIGPLLRLQREPRPRAVNRPRLARQPLGQIRPGVKLHPRLIGKQPHPPPRGRINRHHRRPRTTIQAQVVIKPARRHRRIQRPQLSEIKRCSRHIHRRPQRQQRGIHRQIAIRRDLQHLAVHHPAALPGHVEIGVVHQINHRIRRRPRRHRDLQLPWCYKLIARAHLQRARKAHLAIRAVQAKRHAARVAPRHLPQLLVKPLRPAMQMVRALVAIQLHRSPVQHKPPARNPVGIPPTSRAKIRRRMVHIALHIIMPQHDIAQNPAAPRHPQLHQPRAISPYNR